MNLPASDAVAQTTPTGRAVAAVVAQAYALGAIEHCLLLRRGFNHVYGLRFAGGRRAVARISGERPRGAPNVDYEAALLAHLQASGVSVAACLPTREGPAATAMPLPEGPRALMLFEHLDGDPPGDEVRDAEATGRALALLHEAGHAYRGAASLYALELPYLLWQPLDRICSLPAVDEGLRAAFAALAQRLQDRISGLGSLCRVACHGDCHGGNNFMSDGADGTRIASFFDFDDCGPGCLAYELSVYLWAMWPRKAGGELDVSSRERWTRYLAGYRSIRAIADADFEAIPLFMAVRQFWLMGEYAGRIAVWGTETMPASWLRKQVEMLHAWESLQAPA